MEHYFFISNKDSDNLFSFNTSNLFTINLIKEYDLKGHWKVGITEFSYNCDCAADNTEGGGG